MSKTIPIVCPYCGVGCNLELTLDDKGKPGCGVAPLRGQNHVQGACDLGALPNMLPGHNPVDDEACRTHVEGIWGCKLSSQSGLSAPEMFHEIASGKIRALYVVGENPAVSETQSTFVAWMLQRLELLVVQDSFPTETSRYVDILLPATTLGEKAGTYINAARRVQYTAGGIAPPGEARADWQILQDLANEYGWMKIISRRTPENGAEVKRQPAHFLLKMWAVGKSAPCARWGV